MHQEAINKFWAEVRRGEPWECWIYAAAMGRHKYGMFGNVYAHRFAYNISHPKPAPDDMLVLHICRDNPRCVNPAHLYIGTYSDNNRDTVRDGRHPSRKLSDEEVKTIRKLYDEGRVTHRKLAAEFKVHKSTVSAILSGDHYSWLT